MVYAIVVQYMESARHRPKPHVCPLNLNSCVVPGKSHRPSGLQLFSLIIQSFAFEGHLFPQWRESCPVYKPHFPGRKLDGNLKAVICTRKKVKLWSHKTWIQILILLLPNKLIFMPEIGMGILLYLSHMMVVGTHCDQMHCHKGKYLAQDLTSWRSFMNRQGPGYQGDGESCWHWPPGQSEQPHCNCSPARGWLMLAWFRACICHALAEEVHSKETPLTHLARDCPQSIGGNSLECWTSDPIFQ